MASDQLSGVELDSIGQIFEATYRAADRSYLEKSRVALRYVALAERSEQIVGFSFGDSVRVELPRLQGPQTVALAGIGCISDRLQRQGLFGRLAIAAMRSGEGIEEGRPLLFAGRMAHIVTYRLMAKLGSNTVPTPGKAVRAWHGEVGAAVAALFGVEVDPETLVVQGSGTPVGFPRIETTSSVEEQALFAQVDRSRGDSLLSMCWFPEAPDGW